MFFSIQKSAPAQKPSTQKRPLILNAMRIYSFVLDWHPPLHLPACALGHVAAAGQPIQWLPFFFSLTM